MSAVKYCRQSKSKFSAVLWDNLECPYNGSQTLLDQGKAGGGVEVSNNISGE